MYCDNFRREIIDCIEREVELTEAAQGHIDECGECHRYYQEHMAIIQELQSEFEKTIPVLSNEMLAKIRQGCESDEVTETMGARGGVLKKLSAIAAVAAAAILTIFLLQQEPVSNAGHDDQGAQNIATEEECDDGALIIAWLVAGDAIEPKDPVHATVTTMNSVLGETKQNFGLDTVADDSLRFVASLEKYAKLHQWLD